jgi:hypothetical protein
VSSCAGRFLADWEGDGEAERARQERELDVRHAIAEMEFALAREAVHVGRALAELGLEFDPVTFVALRVLEVGSVERSDPIDVLSWLLDDGAIDRSVALAFGELEGLDGGDALPR